MEKKIGQRTFRADKMVASVAVTYMFRVGKIAAPLIAGLKGVKLASLIDDKGVKGDDSKTLEMIAGFLSELDPVEGQKLVIELAEKAEVQQAAGHYEPVIFDAHFTDNVMDGFLVAALVIQANFSSFFGGKLGAR